MIPFLHGAAEIVYCHQERFDGSGYPRGLKGEEIPIAARVIAVADTLDALSCDRPVSRG
jgi:response regulator RpfG family c-di-GMP phosphodiesterase